MKGDAVALGKRAAGTDDLFDRTARRGKPQVVLEQRSEEYARI